MKQRVGIFSGTFDPVHVGHITFALETMRICNLDIVAFLAERQPRGKRKVTDISHRIALLEKVTATTESLCVIEPTSEQFTVWETLPELRSTFKDAALTLLVGSDVVRTFPYRWQDLDILLSEVALAIGMRSDDNPDEIVAIIHTLEKKYSLAISYTLIHTPDTDVASSQIRNGAIDLSKLPPAAIKHIHEHGLYR